MHPKEVAHYAALSLDAADLIDYYRIRGFHVCHKPWDDPAHRPLGKRASFEEELRRIQAESLECFDQLPKPVLLHCSAGIDRSSPVAAFICSQRSRGAAD
jgi:protein-tyrosine phosphatase